MECVISCMANPRPPAGRPSQVRYCCNVGDGGCGALHRPCCRQPPRSLGKGSRRPRRRPGGAAAGREPHPRQRRIRGRRRPEGTAAAGRPAAGSRRAAAGSGPEGGGGHGRRGEGTAAARRATAAASRPAAAVRAEGRQRPRPEGTAAAGRAALGGEGRGGRAGRRWARGSGVWRVRWQPP